MRGARGAALLGVGLLLAGLPAGPALATLPSGPLAGPAAHHVVGPLLGIADPVLGPLAHVGNHVEVLTASRQGGPGDQYGYGVARDAAGNAYVVGYGYTGDWGNPYDLQLAKWDPQGQPVWRKAFDFSPYDQGVNAAAAADGDVVVTGLRYAPARGTYEPMVARLSADGELRWDRAVPVAGAYAYAWGVAVAPSGDVVVGGTVYLPGSYQARPFLARFDASGSLQHVTVAEGGPEQEVGFGAAVDGSNNAYLVGAAVDGSAVRVTLTKFSPAGEVLARGGYARPPFALAFSVAMDPAGNPVVGGYTLNAALLPVGLVARFRPDLTVEWATDVGAGFYDAVVAVAVDRLGLVAAAGLTRASPTSLAGDDVLVARLLPTGQVLFTRAIDTGPNELAYGVAVNDAGTEIVTGGLVRLSSDYDMLLTRSLGASAVGLAGGAGAALASLEHTSPPPPPPAPPLPPGPRVPRVCVFYAGLELCAT